MHLKKSVSCWLFTLLASFVLIAGCNQSSPSINVGSAQSIVPQVSGSPTSTARISEAAFIQPEIALREPWPTFVEAVKLGGKPANSLQALGSPTAEMGDYQWDGPNWVLLVGVNPITKRVVSINGSYHGGTQSNSVADIASALGVRKKPYRAYLSLSSAVSNGLLDLYVGYTQSNGNVLVINGLFPQNMLRKTTDFNTARDTYSISSSFSLDKAVATEVYWGPQTKNIFGSGYNEITWIGKK